MSRLYAVSCNRPDSGHTAEDGDGSRSSGYDALSRALGVILMRFGNDLHDM